MTGGLTGRRPGAFGSGVVRREPLACAARQSSAAMAVRDAG